MRTVAIIQARMGSTRLPAKILMPLAGEPMLQRVIERASRAPGVDAVVVATTVLPGDDAVATLVERLGVAVVRGPAEDVLARYHLALERHPADAVLRITADCPLLSPKTTGRVIAAFAAGGCDYASNTLRRTYPRGLDSEVLSADALRAAHREAVTPSDREHVTIFVWRQPERFALRSVSDDVDHSDLRWTVDTPSDLRLVERIYDHLRDRPDFEYEDVLALYALHPELREINRAIEQKPLAAG